MGGLTQANSVLISYNSAVMAQLAQTNVTMNATQAQLNTLSSDQTNQTRKKRKQYYWGCGRNYIHGSKNCS